MKIRWFFVLILILISRIKYYLKSMCFHKCLFNIIKLDKIVHRRFNLPLVILLAFMSQSFTNNSNIIDYSAYFPINQNIRWTYQVIEDGGKYQQTVSMVQSDQFSNSYFIETNGKRNSVYDYYVANGIVYLKNIKVDWGPLPFMISLSCSTPIPVFKLLATDKCFWTWRGTIENLVICKQIEVSYNYLNFEETTTPLGKFECLKVKTSYKDGSDNKVLISWFAKGLGLIKEKSLNYEKLLIEYEKFNYDG